MLWKLDQGASMIESEYMGLCYFMSNILFILFMQKEEEEAVERVLFE